MPMYESNQDQSVADNRPVPLTIIGGFLGAGKTSLLGYLLSAKHQQKIAVLVNDFGKLNIDAELIVNVEGETVSLTNGCICCTIRDDLLKEVLKLLNKPHDQRPERIVIETSGVSDPTLVAHTFMLPAMQSYVDVDSIISVIDAEQVLKQKAECYELIERQIRLADLVVINKIDLINESILEQVRNHVNRLAPQARILESTHGRVPIDLVFGPGKMAEVITTLTQSELQPMTPEFETWTYTCEQPFSLMAVRKLVEDMPKGIYRAKGFLTIESMPGERAELQMTGGRAWIRLGGEWSDGLSSSVLVLIGRQGEVDASSVKILLDQYQLEYSEQTMKMATEPIRVKNLRALSVAFN